MAHPSEQTGGRRAPVKVLVVDDEPDLEALIRQRFRRRIRDGELEFSFAPHGQAALEQLDSAPEISVVLTDLNMPVMDGLTFLGHLSERDRIYKAVVISAYGDLENIRTAMNRGAFDFLTKPIDFRDLETTLDKTIGEAARLLAGRAAEDDLSRVQHELKVAADIQRAILPKQFPAFPDRSEIDLHASMTPANEVGGDFYDFFWLDADRLAFVVADVCGKGVPAALFMAVVRTQLRAVARIEAAPGACLTRLNELVREDNEAALFVTLVYGVLHIGAGTVAYANAGHPPPYRWGNGQPPSALPNQGDPILGVFDGLAYTDAELPLAAGEGLLIYTDGVTEAMGHGEAFYRTQRLEARLRAGLPDHAAGTVEAVKEDVNRFRAGHPLHDDITLLSLQYRGANGGA